MPKRKKNPWAEAVPDTLSGWAQIAPFLGHPAAVVPEWS